MLSWHIALENTELCVCVCVAKNTSTHASTLWRTGQYSSTSPCCVCVWERRLCMKEKPAHTLHCNAWVEATLPELIQAHGRVHFLQYLKHIIGGGGANSFALINHRAERLDISKWILFYSSWWDFFLLGLWFIAHQLPVEFWRLVDSYEADSSWQYSININHKSKVRVVVVNNLKDITSLEY